MIIFADGKHLIYDNMNIAIIGYGKMGRMIERIALSRGHNIVAIIDADNKADIDSEAFASADVAIEFTTPSAALDNCRRALLAGVKVVSGSTGWSNNLPEIKAFCDSNPDSAFLWSSNFSLGVNLFFAINRYTARLMSKIPSYTPRMKEIHHIHKLDHPSGTAITLAEQIIAENDNMTRWSETETGNGTLTIDHERIGEVPGTHIISWDSPVDTITLEHKAKSREGFALGAVMAAEWLSRQTGFRSIDQFIDSLI